VKGGEELSRGVTEVSMNISVSFLIFMEPKKEIYIYMKSCLENPTKIPRF
jgi:hypothetical protein